MATIFQQRLRAKKATIIDDGYGLTPDSTLSEFFTAFEYDLRGRGRADATISGYGKQFRKLCLWIGYNSCEVEPRLDDEATVAELTEMGLMSPIRTLDEDGIGAYYHDWLTTICDLSEQSVIAAMRDLRVYYYWMADKHLVRQQKISFRITEPPIKTVLTDTELKALTCRKPPIDSMVEYRNWLMAVYLINTGNRIGSVLELRVKDIDFDGNTLRIQHTKTRQPQVAPMPNHLKTILREWISAYRTDPEDYVFCNAFGQHLSYDAASDAMADYFAEHNVKWRGFHIFRHTYAHHWITSGGDALTLKAALGHKTLMMTQRYVALFGTDIQQAANKHGLQNVIKITSGRSKLKIKKSGED